MGNKKKFKAEYAAHNWFYNQCNAADREVLVQALFNYPLAEMNVAMNPKTQCYDFIKWD